MEYSRVGTYSATIETTNKVTIEVDLYNDTARYVDVENFINLAQSDFYDGADINPEGRQADRFDDVSHPDMKHNDAGMFFITHRGKLKHCAAPYVSCTAVFGQVTSVEVCGGDFWYNWCRKTSINSGPGIEDVFNTRIESIVIHDIGQ